MSGSDYFRDFFEHDNKVYAQILADIARGVYVSGDRLVTTQLAKRYQTSINPIREAIKQLEGEGFVSSQKNSGARVAKFTYQTMRDVFEILQLLEPYLFDWYTQRYSQDCLIKLNEVLHAMRGLDADEHMRFRELDTEFHWQMYKHHYNQSAVNLWKKNKLILQALNGNIPISLARRQHAIEEHEKILSALVNKKPQDAIQALSDHISQGGEYWSKVLVQ
ncbi:GntR family transcriptional regulator [Catenovulum sediminis]|uniref:GntR family transcriptional regulator n=1 Tax=Catenovulum sediminis TaxID=1740262 RepID=A0ABV1RIG5_9ALTE